MAGDDRSRLGPRRPRGAQHEARSLLGRRDPSWGRAAALSVVLAWLGGRPARAEGPGVEIDELPPLPVADEPPASSVAVVAASAAGEDVVLGAAKREQSLGSVASAVTVISGDRIRRFGYRTVGEAVGAVAGAYLVDNRLSYSIGIRGLQIPGDFNTRLLVLIDGATVNEAWGEFAGVGYDALVAIDEVARIEVIRGPVSSVYGTNAFFGIINIVTRGAAETPRAWAQTAINSVNGVTAGAGFAAGDVHRQLRGSVHVMDRFGDTTTLAQLPGVALTGDGSSALSAALAGVYDGSFAQIRAYRYNRQSPFAPYDVDPQGRPYEQHDTQLLAEGGHTRELTDHLTIAARIYGNVYQFDDSAPPMAGSPLDTKGTAQVIGAEARGRYEVIAPNKLGITAGTEASYDRTRSTARHEDGSGQPVDVPFVYNVEGVYVEVDAQPAPWLGFTAGLRYDRNSAFENRTSPRVALFVAEPERYGVKLLYAQGFRAASAFESYFEDNADFASNPAIKPEVISSYEAVAWAKPRPGLSLRLSGFYWDASNVIEQQSDPNDSTLLRFENAGRYVSLGVEAEASYRDGRGWYAFGGFAFSRVGFAEQPVDGEPGAVAYGSVPNAPAFTASGGVSTPKLFGRVHVSSEVMVLGERATRSDANDAASPASPAWIGWNALVYAPSIAGFDVTAGVRNILGTRDLVPAPGDYDRTVPMTTVVPRVPAEGREVYVKIGYSY
jgi:outer membrane receptor protein involved in Fe transport